MALTDGLIGDKPIGVEIKINYMSLAALGLMIIITAGLIITYSRLTKTS